MTLAATPAAYYGLQPAVPVAPNTVATAAGQSPVIATEQSPTVATPANTPAAPGAWHQRAVLVIVLILAGAWVLSRLAEHGAGFGIWGKA